MKIKDENKRVLIEDIKLLSMDLTNKNVQSYASSTAFFFFVSLIPFLMIISAFLPYTSISEDELIRLLTTFTPDIADELVKYIIGEAYRDASGLLSFSLVTIIYTSCMGMLAVLKGLNQIYEVDEKRNYFILVGISVFYTLILGAIIIASLLLMVFGETILNSLIELFPYSFSVPILYPFRYILIIGASTLLFMILYSFVPGERQPFRKQFPGAIFSSLVWGLFSFFFSAFVNSNSIYNTYYGSLAGIVILLLWLYGCFYILLLGAYINFRLQQIKSIGSGVSLG